MSELKDYFTRKVDETYDHPLLRIIDAAENQPELSGVRIEVQRPRDGLVFRPAKIHLHLLGDAGQDVQPDQVEDWDDVLNRALVMRGVRSVSTENEAVRFSLSLRSAFQIPENRFGDGFFNAMLVHHIANSPFADHPTVKSVLKDVYRNGVDPSRKSYGECMSLIEIAIRGRAMELVENLAYEISDAEEILAAAVAQYLDERFSVTNRRLMGLL